MLWLRNETREERKKRILREEEEKAKNQKEVVFFFRNCGMHRSRGRVEPFQLIFIYWYHNTRTKPAVW